MKYQIPVVNVAGAILGMLCGIFYLKTVPPDWSGHPIVAAICLTSLVTLIVINALEINKP